MCQLKESIGVLAGDCHLTLIHPLRNDSAVAGVKAITTQRGSRMYSPRESMV